MLRFYTEFELTLVGLILIDDDQYLFQPAGISKSAGWMVASAQLKLVERLRGLDFVDYMPGMWKKHARYEAGTLESTE
jgi:hypothetical protein